MAYELAHALQQDGRGLDLVVVAGPSPMAYTSDVREDTDAALTAHLRERDGVAISARVEQLFLDIIRGDRALTYDYSRPSREPLSAQAVVITPAMETGHPLLTRAWDREFRDDPRHISIREPSLLPSHGQGSADWVTRCRVSSVPGLVACRSAPDFLDPLARGVTREG